MNRAVVSLAVLKANWDHAKKNYLESFIPFVATLISKKKLKDFSDIRSMCDDFVAEWGLHIPYHPMITILNYAKKRGFIKKEFGRFVPDERKIKAADFSDISAEQERKAGQVIEELMQFAQERHKVTLTREEAEGALISFLKQHDIDILFASQFNTVLPKVQGSSKQRFLTYSFVKHSYTSNYEIFRFIVSIAVGHMLASTLLYRPADDMVGNLKNVTFYLDTGLTLALLGVDGEERRSVAEEFLTSLRTEKGTLKIFRINYEEVKGLLENARVWVDSPNFDPSMATEMARNLRRSGFKQSDVERIIVDMDSRLKKYNIEVVDFPEPDELKKYQIDETELERTIKRLYQKGDPKFDEFEKARTIDKDVAAISAIYKLRKRHRPINIGDSRYVFVGVNSTLARASSLFERSSTGGHFSIPPCITDVFLGTFVWLQAPLKVAEVASKKIIADCYAGLQPSQRLLKLYVAEVEKLRKENRIDEKEYYLLRTHRVACDLLQEKTMGDPESFTPNTPEEIYCELQERIRKEEEEKYQIEKEQHRETREALSRERREKEQIVAGIERVATRFSGIMTFLFLVVVAASFFTGLIILAFPRFLVVQGLHKTLLIAIVIILSFLSSYGGYSIKWLRVKARGWIRRRIVRSLTQSSTRAAFRQGRNH